MPASKSRYPRLKNRPDTPMPTSRHCDNCGNRHAAPTGKKCEVVAARSLQPEETSNLCEDEIQHDLGNRASSLPVSSPVQHKGKQDFTTPANIPGSMNLLADNLVLLRNEMSSMKSELKVLRQEKSTDHSDSWLKLQGAHNASKLNNVIHNDFISVSPPKAVRQPVPV